MNEYQQKMRALYDRTASHIATRERMANLSIGLAEETGEVCKAVRGHMWGGKPANVLEELGDVLFFVAVLADTFGFTLAEVAENHEAKMDGRYPVEEPSLSWVNMLGGPIVLEDSKGSVHAEIISNHGYATYSVTFPLGDGWRTVGTFYDIESAKSWCMRELKNNG